MLFRMNPAPYQRSKRTTTSIMLELSVVLAIVWLLATVFYFVSVAPTLGIIYGFKPLIIGVLALLTGTIVDVVCALIQGKRSRKDIVNFVINQYSFVTALIFALTLTVDTSYYAVICGMLFATIIGKAVFGGFGHNIFNPAALGRVFVSTTFTMTVPYVYGLMDKVTRATATSAINWTTGLLPTFGTTSGANSLITLFVGNYVGSLGETSFILLAIAGIYLAIRKIIDWRLAVSYIGTVFVISLVLGFVLVDVNNPIIYALTHIAAGGVMFGAVFMATDPVTTPTSPMGKLIWGIGVGTITVMIRVFGNLPEGVVYAICIMNIVTPTIDAAIKGMTSDKLWKKYAVTFGILALGILINAGICLIGGAA